MGNYHNGGPSLSLSGRPILVYILLARKLRVQMRLSALLDFFVAVATVTGNRIEVHYFFAGSTVLRVLHYDTYCKWADHW